MRDATRAPARRRRARRPREVPGPPRASGRLGSNRGDSGRSARPRAGQGVRWAPARPRRRGARLRRRGPNVRANDRAQNPLDDGPKLPRRSAGRNRKRGTCVNEQLESPDTKTPTGRRNRATVKSTEVANGTVLQVHEFAQIADVRIELGDLTSDRRSRHRRTSEWRCNRRRDTSGSVRTG